MLLQVLSFSRWAVWLAKVLTVLLYVAVAVALSAAGVPVLVDGAHSVGSLYNLKVPDLGCTYFVSTLHKWLCTPKVGRATSYTLEANTLA